MPCPSDVAVAARAPCRESVTMAPGITAPVGSTMVAESPPVPSAGDSADVASNTEATADCPIANGRLEKLEGPVMTRTARTCMNSINLRPATPHTPPPRPDQRKLAWQSMPCADWKCNRGRRKGDPFPTGSECGDLLSSFLFSSAVIVDEAARHFAPHGGVFFSDSS